MTLKFNSKCSNSNNTVNNHNAVKDSDDNNNAVNNHNAVKDSNDNNNPKENETNHHNRDTDIVFDHSSRLLQCTADESITHACCGAQLTVISGNESITHACCGAQLTVISGNNIDIGNGVEATTRVDNTNRNE